MKPIEITGPLGAGKDTAADYLAQQLGATHVSGGSVLRHMLVRLGLEPKKSALGDFGVFLRTHFGADVVVKEVLRQAGGNDDFAVISGARSPSEITVLKDAGGLIVYITAAAKLRHRRVKDRRREGDQFKAEHLEALDIQEGVGDHEYTENLQVVKEMADIVIDNNGTLAEFHAQLDKVADQIKSQMIK